IAIINAEKSRLQVVGYEQERYLFQEDKIEVYYLLAEALLAQGRKQEAFLCVEKAKASVLLDAYTQSLGKREKTISPEEKRVEFDLRAKIAHLNCQLIRAQTFPQLTDGSVDLLRQELDRARTAYEDFIAKVRHKDLKDRLGSDRLSEQDA